MPDQPFETLIASVRACTLCASQLAAGVRPVLQADPRARILVAGQAPGTKVHASGIPFDDPSGDRLRSWMGVDRDTFYDANHIAIIPMGLCYPGKGKSGDLPPRPECAPTWREQLLAQLPDLRLTLVIGQYAHAWHLPFRERTLTATVRDWARYDDSLMPLPHPSPRNNIWLKKNPWFELDAVPVLRQRVARTLG